MGAKKNEMQKRNLGRQVGKKNAVQELNNLGSQEQKGSSKLADSMVSFQYLFPNTIFMSKTNFYSTKILWSL